MSSSLLRRKGFAVVLDLMIGLVVLVLIFIITTRIQEYSKAAYSEEECKLSLSLTRNFKLVGMPDVCMIKVANPIPIKCPRSFITVTDDKVVRDGEESQLYSSACAPGIVEGAGQSCISGNVVSEEMRTCWRMFSEGKQPAFQQVEIDEASLTRDTNVRACYVCSEITLKSKEGVKLKEYLQKARMSIGTLDQKQEISYYDYITNKNAICDKKLLKPDTPSCWEAIAQQGDNSRPVIDQTTLPTDQTYAVVFMRRGMGTCEESKVKNMKEDDKYALTNSVQIFPAKDIAKQCDLVVV